MALIDNFSAYTSRFSCIKNIVLFISSAIKIPSSYWKISSFLSDFVAYSQTMNSMERFRSYDVLENLANIKLTYFDELHSSVSLYPLFHKPV